MGKHFAPTNNCRPSVDHLEDRHLLSGLVDVIHVSLPPAISLPPAMIAGHGLVPATRVADFPRSPLMPSFAYGPGLNFERTYPASQGVPGWDAFSPIHTGFETIVVYQAP